MVELMVGMVIALLGTLAIFQVFALSEGQKRSTTSASDSQQNGSLALLSIERDIRQAGYGIFDASLLGCNVSLYDKVRGGNYSFPMAPVVITQTANKPDAIAIMYSDSELQVESVGIQGMTGATADITTNNRFGFGVGDLIVVGEPGQPCSVAQVSGLPMGAAQTNDLSHANTGATRFNSATGVAMAYTAAARVLTLGQAPANNAYTIDSAFKLQMTSNLTGDAVAVADDIVDMKAQYGKDTDGDTFVDTYDNVTPTTPAGWAQVRAIRIAVLARSALLEKNPVTQGGSITLWATSTVAPTTTGPTHALAAADLYYRYKVYETIVPIRNVIWQP